MPDPELIEYTPIDKIINQTRFTGDESPDEQIQILKTKFPTWLGDQQMILDGIRLLRPDYAITAEDEAQRKERREISQIARDNMFQFLTIAISLEEKTLTKEQLLAPKSYRMLERGLGMLFDHSRDPDAAAHNDRIRELFMCDGNHEYTSSIRCSFVHIL